MFAFSVVLTVAGTESGKVMLNRAINRVLRAPMSFFDTTPLGRITNRFSKDIDVSSYLSTILHLKNRGSCNIGTDVLL
jgi:ABC-type multidrug transport system fused ATPase/permease subunit